MDERFFIRRKTQKRLGTGLEDVGEHNGFEFSPFENVCRRFRRTYPTTLNEKFVTLYKKRASSKISYNVRFFTQNGYFRNYSHFSLKMRLNCRCFYAKKNCKRG